MQEGGGEQTRPVLSGLLLPPTLPTAGTRRCSEVCRSPCSFPTLESSRQVGRAFVSRVTSRLCMSGCYKTVSPDPKYRVLCVPFLRWEGQASGEGVGRGGFLLESWALRCP